jgi:uncharacterized protein YhjY with autotransporter beta-barrel domain
VSSRLKGLFGLMVTAIVPLAARADLTDPRILAQLNALETAAAQANQATFDALSGPCAAGPGPACPDDVFGVFEETRELVHTANELLGTGETTFSLSLDIDGLGFALRWTAAEELAAQGSMTTEFAASQISALSARMAALRWGISGPRLTRAIRDGDGAIRVAQAGTLPLGGGASADAEQIGSPWSWFLDGAFGYGDKDPTVLEDAFDFEGQEITFGVDYRFSPGLAAGAMIGYSSKEVDFDSARSVVDGLIESDGYSGIVYALLEGQRAYLNGSLGYQRLTHDSRRRITYPSQNPLIPAVDSLATGSTDSSSLLATLAAGYAFRWGGFSVEPSLGLDYLDARVDGFRESSIDTVTNSPMDPFNLQIGDQDIESLDANAGLQIQHVFTPPFGVLVPYLSGRYHRETLDDVRRVSARYADAYEQLLQNIFVDFNVPTDPPDEDYYTAAAGVTVVLAGGLMGFVQYLEVLDLDDYSDSVITGGMRYEFGR